MQGAGEEVKISSDEVKILNKLGSGAAGSVHRAVYKGKEIAVKIINIFERSKRHQLLKEIRSLSKIKSEYVAEFVGAFFSDSAIHIAMEYLDAGSLDDVLRLSKFPVPAIRVVSAQLLRGLDSLHSQKLMHRDIKPSNICLSSRGDAKFTDFGIAREVTETVGVAKTFVGTFNYMSPERIQGHEYSYNSDIWSLGLSLLQCVLGRYPYTLTDVYFDLMHQIVKNPVPCLPPIEAEIKAVPGRKPTPSMLLVGQFRAMITACLVKDPSERAAAADLLKMDFVHMAPQALKKEKANLAGWIKKAKFRASQRASGTASGSASGPAPSGPAPSGTAASGTAAVDSAEKGSRAKCSESQKGLHK